MTIISQSVLLFINKRFKLPLHPFNLENDGKMSYAEWQFEKGAQTIAFFTDYAGAEEMFKGKSVLDIGCGAAGKSLYYASLGARRVVGLDVIERYRGEALELARRKGLEDRFEYVCADARDTGFEGGSFDTVIMNDAAEHVAQPEAVFRECLRLLAPGGRLYINFPPYYHPYGAHLSDAIGVPWVHAFFGEKTLIAAYKKLVGGLPDGAQRIGLRVSGGAGAEESRHGAGGPGGCAAGLGAECPGGISADAEPGAERLTYINRMTVKRFRKILRGLPARCVYYREAPLRGFLSPFTKLPGIREFFIKMVVAIIECPER